MSKLENIEEFIRKNFLFFFKYINSGVVSALLDYLVLFLLTSGLGVYYLYSTVIAYFSGFVLNFFLNKYWTFKKEGNTFPQLLKYSLLAGFNFLVTISLMYLLTSITGVNYLISRGIVLVLITGWNFLLYKYVVYK